MLEVKIKPDEPICDTFGEDIEATPIRMTATLKK